MIKTMMRIRAFDLTKPLVLCIFMLLSLNLYPSFSRYHSPRNF
jgi:hypothetical protein